jgi:hypothetical protein
MKVKKKEKRGKMEKEEKLNKDELKYTLSEALDRKLDKELAISIMKELLEKIEAEKKGEK